MIDARECASMALQTSEEAHEALTEAQACFERGWCEKADRWRRVGEALNDAAEAFNRASDEIAAIDVAGHT